MSIKETFYIGRVPIVTREAKPGFSRAFRTRETSLTSVRGHVLEELEERGKVEIYDGDTVVKKVYEQITHDVWGGVWNIGLREERRVYEEVIFKKGIINFAVPPLRIWIPFVTTKLNWVDSSK